MSIASSSILYDGTVAASGGTATSMIVRGGTLNSTEVILDNSAEFALQTKIEFSVKEPRVQASAPNGYTQARTTCKVLKPLLLDNGNYTVNTVSMQLSVDPETTAAEIATLLGLIAQAATDSDFTDFWSKQSVA